MAVFNAVAENEISACESYIAPADILQADQPLTLKTAVELERLDYEDEELKIASSLCKIKLSAFPIDRPWLPQEALKTIDKIRKGPVSEKELVALMEMVAEQATIHFQLRLGKFVASTFLGRIVEVSDSRVELLKKIQSRTFTEEIFVWRAGFNSFSGRI